jgi:hypothetical protein
MAWFTDSDQTGDVTFTAGTLKIELDETFEGESFDVLNFDNMNPGDVYKPIRIEIVNTGSKKLFWVGDWVITPEVEGKDKLLEAIYIDSASMKMLDKDDALWTDDPWYSGYDFIKDGRGNNVGHNPGEAAEFNRIADMSTFNVLSLDVWDNNSHMVPQVANAEHMGALKPGNKYVLTVSFGFRKEAGNEYQGDAEGVSPIKVSFKVDAMQVNQEAMNDYAPGLGDHQYNWAMNQINVQPD